MALVTVNTGDTLYPTVVNQAITILQRQAGQSDVGQYEVAGNSYTSTGLFQSAYVQSRSRNAVPVSVSVDSSSDALNGLTGLTAAQITAGGVQVYASASAATGNCHTGGNCTFNY